GQPRDTEFSRFCLGSQIFVDQKRDPCPGNPLEGWSWGRQAGFLRARASNQLPRYPSRMMTTGVLVKKIKTNLVVKAVARYSLTSVLMAGFQREELCASLPYSWPYRSRLVPPNQCLFIRRPQSHRPVSWHRNCYLKPNTRAASSSSVTLASWARTRQLG